LPPALHELRRMHRHPSRTEQGRRVSTLVHETAHEMLPKAERRTATTKTKTQEAAPGGRSQIAPNSDLAAQILTTDRAVSSLWHIPPRNSRNGYRAQNHGRNRCMIRRMESKDFDLAK
jgi:hypothetical protein